MLNESNDITIDQVVQITDEIYQLLLLADPSKVMIEQYINTGKVFAAKDLEKQIVGIYVLVENEPETMEIINVAVAENHQSKGIGKLLIKDAVKKAGELGAKTVEIGTGNSSLIQLALYQKCGFRVVGVDSDFFTRNYSEPIFENGIQCIDMIRLRMKLEGSEENI